jgi:predicted aminopeptidase
MGDSAHPVRRFLHHLAPVLCSLALISCQTAGFYQQAVRGQWEILAKSKPIPPLLADPATDPALREKLAAVQEIRRFASGHLGLPGSESYGTYADLGRDHVTWVLYAAPEFSLDPKTWWYPTLGKLDYRGFFQEAEAQKLAGELRSQGYDVEVGGVDAYSTLGWFHDPVLNCFVHEAEVDLAELIFHELTHRRLFRNGDTAFNESLATAYAEDGVKKWLRHQRRAKDLRAYEQLLVRRKQFYDQIDITRARLEALYAGKLPADEMRTRKRALMKSLQDRFRELRRRWGGRGLESWLEQDLNNAHIVSILTYHKNGPVFHRLLEEVGGDPDAFFKRAGSLKLPD